MANPSSEIEPHARFRACAATHGLRLHRVHLLGSGKVGSLPCTLVFDCRCGQRWLMRVAQSDVVAVDGALLAELRRARDGQPTAPPGFPGAE